MRKRVYNFSAGPSMLAEEVLKKLQKEMLSYEESGMSVMEMSHRSKVYLSIFGKTKDALRRVLDIPEDYEILFMQGGATMQFSCVPLNLMKNGKADYIITGNFSKKAAEEAAKYGEVHIAYDGKENGYSEIPSQEELNLSRDASYVHICSNNTIYGTEWQKYPDTNGIPLVADMSSDILSRRINVRDFGLIYAGAQKNMGIAGLAVVIVRKDLITEHSEKVPVLLQYDTTAKNDSMYNTPSTYSIYVLGEVLEWIEETGGLEEIERRNREKAGLLYAYLDEHPYYRAHSKKEARSLMNVTFTTPEEDLDRLFALEAEKRGLTNLKGHRLVGGIRASIYNAMPLEGVKELIQFMEDFRKENAI